jgi:hypothetical protein
MDELIWLTIISSGIVLSIYVVSQGMKIKFAGMSTYLNLNSDWELIDDEFYPIEEVQMQTVIEVVA